MTLNDAARRLIDRLQLSPHPEGGWYRETHRSPVSFAASALPVGYESARCAVTSILFLLPAGVRSRPHRVRSEEIFVHHDGDALRLFTDRVEPHLFERAAHAVTLGPGAEYQAVVPAGWWQAAEVGPGPNGYALVGCIVAPGFEFADFEMAE